MRRVINKTYYSNCIILTLYILVLYYDRFTKLIVRLNGKTPHILLETHKGNIFHFRTTKKKEQLAPFLQEMQPEIFRRKNLDLSRKTIFEITL